MKFGGAAFANGNNILNIAKIVKDYKKRNRDIVIVASAMEGVTDKLFLIGELLKKKQLKKALNILHIIKKQHISALKIVSRKEEGIRIEIEMIKLFSQLENYVKNISMKDITPARIDFLVSFGERFVIRLVTEALERSGVPAYPIDASNILATTHNFGNAIPLPRIKQNYLDQILTPLVKRNIVPVVTGYIGYSGDGCTTTLGRGGSDLTATFLANFLDAQAIYLWKDVLGFYNDDPHKNKKATLFEKLSYDKAEKLAKNGAKVVYYKAILPVRKKRIPIYVRSYLKPQERGTTIS
ncbi:hypothetical protein A3H80_04795 [Candidatus Roizmanbacteria bacterium RIFCSPLOWO2_02_FULL_37_19]|uniref:Aspartokinase n=1 Tax=Candidatus Roizmanbacteria bacterium RIFCSPHIGHO2_02_FULL_37_24 TaxID=1802037 RepID=A0A1F7GVV9_9BACT|nr:MAG: hypothetical protein A2862_02185 [Candidatus Roizmanbacteria bacterium RIFCSPHIGHO2_01_FULL_38_41]OGK23207.1 MAG: hypothetical protein A3C24_00940 [Candidatus Roizmanbacteria bacterium RIFCSPHIGHO2_02_FULL_37_24]OGK33293.1 MAG: hypothetical protein A3E10_00805 [Candidatus Roizmanbacteria bacterium RIFCSPHIGHO2_12_FULL_37_23]OGK43620.1 MAG: hypothetical protein A2956_04285 [Candidatus Roizmanbacteria bacterium RIFCSPLOWO2_01_FULL_37_57]OGK54798.1 MAG: hypothetical protein A3H80_04795 [Ca